MYLYISFILVFLHFKERTWGTIPNLTSPTTKPLSQNFGVGYTDPIPPFSLAKCHAHCQLNYFHVLNSFYPCSFIVF